MVGQRIQEEVVRKVQSNYTKIKYDKDSAMLRPSYHLRAPKGVCHTELVPLNSPPD